jgi:hypothetical protein
MSKKQSASICPSMVKELTEECCDEKDRSDYQGREA